MLCDRVKNIVKEARDMAAERGIQASIQVHRENSHLMRIGNNSVSLNTGEELTRVDIEVISGRKKGTHTILGELTNSDDLFKIILMVDHKAKKSNEMDYQPVLTVLTCDTDMQSQYDSQLDDLAPSVKESVFSEIFRVVGEGYNYSGSWSSGSTETFLVTTASRFSSRCLLTDQQFTCVLKHPEKKWELASWQTGWKAGDVTAACTVDEFKRLLPVYENMQGVKVEPGHYTVVFGSQAVGEVLQMAVWTGCAGRTWEMRMGWTSDKKIGDDVFHPSVTVLDDPLSPDVFSSPVSDSGMPALVLPMIEKGKFAGIAYDRNTASKYGKEPTANAGCLSMLPGDGPEDFADAVREMDRVLYIPAIHYMNLPNMSKGIFTGSSRFSAVMLEKGKIVGPIFSSRITDQFQTVFGNILGMSPVTVGVNTSNTYGRRSPSAVSVPSWILVGDVKITDCADSF